MPRLHASTQRRTPLLTRSRRPTRLSGGSCLGADGLRLLWLLEFREQPDFLGIKDRIRLFGGRRAGGGSGRSHWCPCHRLPSLGGHTFSGPPGCKRGPGSAGRGRSEHLVQSRGFWQIPTPGNAPFGIPLLRASPSPVAAGGKQAGRAESFPRVTTGLVPEAHP